MCCPGLGASTNWLTCAFTDIGRRVESPAFECSPQRFPTKGCPKVVAAVQASTLSCETRDINYRVSIEDPEWGERGNPIVRSAPPPHDARYPTGTHVPGSDKSRCHVGMTVVNASLKNGKRK